MIIEIKDLYKRFGKNQVLQGMNLEVNRGEVFAILGPNGSGKTTLIKCILGMVNPNKGTILVNGVDIKGQWSYRNTIDYLPQIANFPSNLTVQEIISMLKNLRSKTTHEQALIERFGLEEYMDKKLGNLSGGTKQKVNLVLTFMFDSELIILDEPTSGLDPVSLIKLKELIDTEKKRGKTILITSHIMSFVEQVAEGIVFILDGKAYFKGSIQALKDTTEQTDFEHAIAHILKGVYA